MKGYVHEVVISCGVDIIARHQRCYGYGETVFNPLHYLPLLEWKVGALDQAAPLANWGLPASFQKLKSVLEKQEGKAGKREYVRVLRLLENFRLEELEKAVQAALHLGAVRYEAIKHLASCQFDQRPPQLSLIDYSHLPAVSVKATQAIDYTQLILLAFGRQNEESYTKKKIYNFEASIDENLR